METKEQDEKRIRQLVSRAWRIGGLLGMVLGFGLGFAVGYGQGSTTTLIVPLTEGIKT